MDKTEQLAQFINESQKIAVFSGAGISCDSGIPDFRSENGLYNCKNGYSFAPEEIISHPFFLRYPDIFYDFYKSKMVFPDAKPNYAHLFFAKLAEKKDVSIITQNIDGLHSMAGNKKVYELHGSIYRNYCTKCKKFFSLSDLMQTESVPKCDICGGIIKPDVVLYEEPLNAQMIDGAIDSITGCDCLIVLGTSLVVQPAASFVDLYRGNRLALINKQNTYLDSRMNLIFNEDITTVLKRVEPLLK